MIGTTQERLKELNELYPVWEARTLWGRLQANVQLFADSEFIVFEDVSFTYQQTLLEVERMAWRLWSLGVRPGDHVCLFMTNCPEHLFLIFALSRINAVETAGNIKISSHELRHILSLTDVKFLISDVELPCGYTPEDALAGAVVIEKDLPRFGDRGLSWEDFLQLEDKPFSPEQTAVLDQAQDPESLVAVFFTSGSTALPKGVMVTHDMILRSAYGTCLCRRMERGRRLCVPLPLFHIMAYSEGVLTMLLTGGTVIMSREKRFSPEHVLWMLRQFKANDIICMSSMMMSMLTKCSPHPEEYPEMHAAYWASICPDWVWDAGRRAFGISDVSTAYGTTECGSTSVMISPDDDPSRVSVCHGRVKPAGSAALPGMDGAQIEIGIFDPETGGRLPPMQRGELRCRGATVTKGYYKDRAATEQALTPDGWFCTGDLGTMDVDGYITFEGRRDDMYKINGENVSPVFVDTVIGQCPGVKAVETVGVPHPKYGAIGVAFLDLKDCSPEAEAEVKRYCAEHLAPFQRPKYFFFSSSSTWPRTGSGKIRKAGLREIAQQEIARAGEDATCGG